MNLEELRKEYEKKFCFNGNWKGYWEEVDIYSRDVWEWFASKLSQVEQKAKEEERDRILLEVRHRIVGFFPAEKLLYQADLTPLQVLEIIYRYLDELLSQSQKKEV